MRPNQCKAQGGHKKSEMDLNWINSKKRKPELLDACPKGYVMVYLRNDRQWGQPTRFGFSKWNRVTSSRHSHWVKIPNAPVGQ